MQKRRGPNKVGIKGSAQPLIDGVKLIIKYIIIMAKKRRKPKKNVVTSKFTPIRYLMTKARGLPIVKTYIKDIWDSDGITIALVIRQQGNGKYIIGCYILDAYCLGLRESFFKFNMTWEEIEFLYLDVNNKVEGGVYVESTPRYV
mgnify:CR=1 FL=1